MEQKKKLIIIAGPTAIGKTAVSIQLAKAIGGEIISADSMQVYKRMDIGTAKITQEEMQGVPHHLIDILEPDSEFNVITFKEMAKKCIEEITGRGHIPIIVGGTGFYIQAVLYDIDFTEYNEDACEKVREELENKLKTHGSLYMHEYLKSFDPESAAIIHMNNTKKLLHAIEYFLVTGRKISDHNKEQHDKESPYDFYYFVITDDRQAIYDRIDRRVDIMIKDGLVDEVAHLKDEGLTLNNMSMLGLGYEQIYRYLCGELTLDEAVTLIKRDTRHFAKKQLTWFNREKTVTFIDRREIKGNDSIVASMINLSKLSYQKSDFGV